MEMQFGGFINPEDLPEHMRRAIEHHIDMDQMNHQDRIHGIQSLITDMADDPDKLETFKGLVGLIGQGNTFGAYYQGLVTGIQIKQGHCMCGESHNPEDLLNQEEPAAKPAPPPMEQQPMREEQREYYEAKLKEYGLEEAPVPGNPERTFLRCANCKTPSVSLEDRMLRKPGPGGCSGCQQKAKWG